MCTEVSDTPLAAARAYIVDAALIDSNHYHIVDSAGAVLDADKMGKPGESGPLRVSLMASLANKRNSNGRFFTPGFMRTAAARGDSAAKQTPMYGEEPHPPFDSVRGQYVSDSTKEVWKSVGWNTDSAGNLWTTVIIDEEAPKGKRVGQKVRRNEKLGVSVRWTPIGNAHKDGTLADGQRVQLFDDDSAAMGFGVMALDHVPNPAFPEVGHAMFDCEGSCELPLLESGIPTGETMTDVAFLEALPPQSVIAILDTADAAQKFVPPECACKHSPSPPTTPPQSSPSLHRTTSMTKPEALTLTPAERKAKLKEFRASAKAATDADAKSEAQEAIAALLDATDEHDTAVKAALDAKAEADAKEAADAKAIADNKTISDNAEKEKSDKDAEEKMAEKATLDALDEKQAKIDAAIARMDAM